MARNKPLEDDKRVVDPRWLSSETLEWKCYDWQLPLYRSLPTYGTLTNREHREFILLAHRDTGKSHMTCTKVLETVKNHKGLSVNIFSGTGKQAKAIFSPKFSKLSSDAPREFVPKYSTADECYSVNDCSITIIGGTTGTADNQRGRDFDFTLIDEPIVINELEYLYTSVILPRILTGTGTCIWLSSAPKTPAHFFAKKIEQAKKEGYIKIFTLADNPRFSADDVKRIADAMGGEESTAFRREMMCEIITDENYAVFPELINNQKLLEHVGSDPITLSELPIYCALAYHDIGTSSALVFTRVEGRVVILEEHEFKNVNPRQLSEFLLRRTHERFGRPFATILSNLTDKDALALSRVTGASIYPTDYPRTVDRVKFAKVLMEPGSVLYRDTRRLTKNLSDAIYNDARSDFLEGLFAPTEAFTVLAERFSSIPNQVGYRHSIATGAEFF